MIAIGDEADLIQVRRHVEAVGRTTYILEIYVDILQCRRLIATKKISNHEIDVMARAIESLKASPETDPSQHPNRQNERFTIYATPSRPGH